MQPFDYRIAVQDPLQMALAGYQQGQQFQQQRVQGERETQLYDMEMQQYQANQAKLQEEQARAQEMQTDLGQFANDLEAGTATRDQLNRLKFQYGDIMGEHVGAAYEGKTQEYKDMQANKIARIGIAFKNSPEEGMRLLQVEKEAAQNAGNQELLDAIEMMEGEAQISAGAPTASALFVLSSLVSPERLEAFERAIFPTPEKAPDAFRALELRAEQAGLPPGSAEYQAFMKQGGEERGPAVQVVMPAEATAFDRRLGEGQADQVIAISNQGAIARRNRNTLLQLQDTLANAPQGAEGGFKSFVGNFGIDTEGLDDIQAAQALISQLVPAQRPPGSGTMSDADLAEFKRSLPRILNQPGGNAKIIETTLAINNYLIEEAKIADQVLDREITPAQGRAKMAEMINPLAEFSAGGGSGLSAQDAAELKRLEALERGGQ